MFFCIDSECSMLYNFLFIYKNKQYRKTILHALVYILSYWGFRALLCLLGCYVSGGKAWTSNFIMTSPGT